MARSSKPQPRQLSLQVHLDDDATFANFLTAADSSNRETLQLLDRQLDSGGESSVYIWGPTGAGISHLLQAACHTAGLRGAIAQYLPLRSMQEFSPFELMQQLESLDLVCVDDVQVIAASDDWEQALFHTFNRLRDNGKRLLLGGHCNPRQLGLRLPDLQSRFNGSLVLQVQPLDDAGKARALCARAGNLGMDMSDDVARFILSRWSRDTHNLFACLRCLDRLSLEQQRRLSIPFVKQALGI